MKVAIISNCQGESLASCINSMNSSVQANFFMSADFYTGKYDMSQVFDEHDKVFAHIFIEHYMHDGVRHKTWYFPNLAFAGYHPDMTYLRGKRVGANDVEAILGPMHSYHSALAVVAFTSGLGVDEAFALYNPENFVKLGYFDIWETSRRDLILEGERTRMPLTALFDKWTKSGCYMYSFNHPNIAAVADIARILMERAGIKVVSQNVAQYVRDPLKVMPIWPVYPSIAERHGGRGDYSFYCEHTGLRADLRQFLELSYNAYREFEPGTLETLNFSLADLKKKLGIGEPKSPSPTRSRSNPYAGAPSVQFWKDSVSSVAASALDPVVVPRFTIEPTEKISTAGSCFAQHIARTLSGSGFNYYVAERAPTNLSEFDAKTENYGVFSARYGNIYTVRQLLQLIDRVYERFAPLDVEWIRRDKKLVDPFRPQITPSGFDDTAALIASREAHFAAVKRVFEDSQVFVFTLGLTEGWRSRLDGAVFPLAPGVAGGEMDFNRYEFINFTYDEIVSDLLEAIDRIKLVNPACRVILTVSPVPLIATFEPRHALVATTYSKSVLRAAADYVTRAYDHVDYFPSYEIITGSYSRGAYFDADLRTVTEQGVSHVMRIFMNHYARASTGATEAPVSAPNSIARRPSALFDIVCDEEAIANFNA